MVGFRAEGLGQIFILEFAEDRSSATFERQLGAWNPGGVLLSRRALRSPEATATLLRKLALAPPTPPLLAIEEEGGAVDPLEEFFPPLPSARAAAERGTAAVERLGDLIGAGLKLLGFNTDFAPVLDFSTPHCGPAVATRTFGWHPNVVVRCGQAFLRGLRRHRILACGKHFPGSGNARMDGKTRPPLSGKPMTELWREDLLPYRKLLGQLPLVMVGHGAYKAYDFDLPRPAAFSESIVEGLLRVKLRYRGVAVAYELEEAARRASVELGEAAVRSVGAGCDMLVVRGGEKSVQEIIVALKRAMESGRISTKRLEQATARIRRAKKGLPGPSGKISKDAFTRLARQFKSFSKDFRPRERRIA